MTQHERKKGSGLPCLKMTATVPLPCRTNRTSMSKS
ncbi:hypothetical protein BamMEX5DRAFT_1378 [Burkholderia ambifaria MEX-5]|uniref:Uncharacterized protein n=1 Tax=Burkholderia ambifaria MEX-5 TaxID=396597 RepID=B1T0R2_9BURK|nr:hypothetical protein BamMEX5DRAFT_1378 [Burkholderia ambifaria MEX-5]